MEGEKDEEGRGREKEVGGRGKREGGGSREGEKSSILLSCAKGEKCCLRLEAVVPSPAPAEGLWPGNWQRLT